MQSVTYIIYRLVEVPTGPPGYECVLISDHIHSKSVLRDLPMLPSVGLGGSDIAPFETQSCFPVEIY